MAEQMSLWEEKNQENEELKRRLAEIEDLIPQKVKDKRTKLIEKQNTIKNKLQQKLELAA